MLVNVYVVANEHVLLEAAYGLGPASVNRAGRMFEVVQAMLALVVRLGKFLQIGQQERGWRTTLSLRMISSSRCLPSETSRFLTIFLCTCSNG